MESEKNTGDGPKRKWRKKRKSFLTNARKYAKKGQHGRGKKMPEDLYQYFVGILEVMKDGVDNDDDKRNLVNNVLERTVGEELNIVGNQLGCRVIELLLPFASPADLERYMTVLSQELRPLCSDNFSSHVIEQLLIVSCQRATDHLQPPDSLTLKEDKDVSEKKIKVVTKEEKVKNCDVEHVAKCHAFTLKVCKYALNNLEDFFWDPYANHILRSALKCLGGITAIPGDKVKKNIFTDKNNEDGKQSPSAYKKVNYRNVPEEFKEVLLQYAERLMAWPQFKDMPFKNLTSGLLQVLLFAIKNADKKLTKQLLTKLLNECFAPDDSCNSLTNEDRKDLKTEIKCQVDDETEKSSGVTSSNLPVVFSSEPAVRCLEAALMIAKKKSYTQIYAKLFINRLSQLVTMPSLNFTVQRLFDCCDIQEEFEPMFDELAGKFSAILTSGNTGVLVSIVKACHRLKSRQTQFVASLEATLKCAEPRENQKYFAPLCARLLPLDRVKVEEHSTSYFINVHGSVILQTMLDFLRPTKAVNSLLEMSAAELLTMFSDAKGSHVADAFFKGQYVGVKARDKMIWKLKGCYQQLAMAQYGSRAFEAVFQAALIEQKCKIMNEIADKSQLLNSTLYGRLIHGKYNLELFSHSVDKWKNHMNKDEKMKDMFKDIVGTKRKAKDDKD